VRIAVGGFLHESHSFAPRPTTYGDFLQPGGLPPFCAGLGLIEAMRTRSVPLAGAIKVAEEAEVDLVPLAWGFANPAGPVEDEAFERIAARICALLSVALDEGPLDGVYLDLHGAAVADSFPDAEGELLRRVRAIVGGDLPLTVSLDPHANLTDQMVRLVDVAVPFRTYPHVDGKAAGGRAMKLLLDRIEYGRPWVRAFRVLDFWIPLGSQCTLMSPMQTVMTERAALAERLNVVELAFCFGFPYADFVGCGAAVTAFAETQAAADAAADAFLAFASAQERYFVQDTLSSAAAVAEAKRLAAGARRPVVLADTQDNPGGGGPGDTTELLAELVRQGGEGRGRLFDQRCRERGRLRRGRRGGDSRFVARWEVGWNAVRLFGCGGAVDGWSVHADRADGGGKSRQFGRHGAAGHSGRAGDGGVAEDAGAGSGDFAPCGNRASILPDHCAEVVRAFPCGFRADGRAGDRGDRAGAGGGGSGSAEFPARAGGRAPAPASWMRRRGERACYDEATVPAHSVAAAPPQGMLQRSTRGRSSRIAKDGLTVFSHSTLRRRETAGRRGGRLDVVLLILCARGI
jgi:hypothetical protein